MRSRLALCLPFLLLPLAVQETPALPPDDVVRHALGDQQRVIDLLAKYTYTKHVASESSNAKGKVTDHQERVFNYAPCDAKTCITLVSVNGAPPKPRELKEHQKVVEKEWEKQAKKSTADRQKEEDDDLFLSRDFLAVYDFSSSGTELHVGRGGPPPIPTSKHSQNGNFRREICRRSLQKGRHQGQNSADSRFQKIRADEICVIGVAAAWQLAHSVLSLRSIHSTAWEGAMAHW